MLQRLGRGTRAGLGHAQVPAAKDPSPDDLVGVLGDPHANAVLTAAALTHLRQIGCTRILCTGDVVDGAGDAGRAIELLRAPDVIAVRGNHDRWLLEGQPRSWDAHETQRADLTDGQVSWLQELPATRVLPTAVGDLLLCHGVGDDDMNRLRVDDYGYALATNPQLQALLADPARPALVVKGHTHRPGVGRPAGLLVVDAGCLRADHQPSVSALDLSRGIYRRWAATAEGWALSEQAPLPGLGVAVSGDGS